MRIRKRRHRLLCALLCAVLLCGGAGADTLSDIENQQQQLQQKQEQLQKENEELQQKLETLREDAQKQQEYYDTLQEQQEVVMQEIDNVNDQLNQLVEGIKAKINLDQLGSKLGGLFGKR